MTVNKSKGTDFQIYSGMAYTSVIQLLEVTAPDAEVQMFNATALDSAAGMEYQTTGYVEGGTASASCLYDPVAASQQDITDNITTPADSTNFKIIWSDSGATEWAFSGSVVSFTPSASLDDGLRADFAVKLNGIVTYTT